MREATAAATPEAKAKHAKPKSECKQGRSKEDTNGSASSFGWITAVPRPTIAPELLAESGNAEREGPTGGTRKGLAPAAVTGLSLWRPTSKHDKVATYGPPGRFDNESKVEEQSPSRLRARQAQSDAFDRTQGT